ncbi:MAG: ORF6N domain-containing protein [Usitatibacter sp.]
MAPKASNPETQRAVEPYRLGERIFVIRGCNVLLDRDLAALYEIEAKVLMQAVRRNAGRFPSDFMFQLTNQELVILRSQFVTSSWGGRRYPPYAFTEQGVAMLSSVLNSPRAIAVNIEIMRTFVRLREAITSNKELAEKFALLEKRLDNNDQAITAILDAIRQLMAPPLSKKPPIGFVR